MQRSVAILKGGIACKSTLIIHVAALLLAAIYETVSFRRLPFLPSSTSASTRSSRMSRNVSERIQHTERPYIEDVLDKYCGIDSIIALALGSSHWQPPSEALKRLTADLSDRSTQRYGSIEGYEPLKRAISASLASVISMDQQEVVITAGANQAFLNIALLLCDAGSDAIILAPYYFSHKLSLQLANATIHECPFEKTNLKPQWDTLEAMMTLHPPRVVVLTTPNNPSGAVWDESELRRIIAMCSKHDSWLVVDQTYHEFTFNGTNHVYPCSKRFGYDKIVHIFSMSKSFGMPGWRVGYAIYPKCLTEHMRKIQDTIPTHTTMISQKLALHCMQFNDEFALKNEGRSWVRTTIASLETVRERLYPILEPLGTFPSDGAFYYLVPLPAEVREEEAVDMLANTFKVLLMPGTPFGAPGHLRLSYGSIPEEQALTAIERLKDGFAAVLDLALSRRVENQMNGSI